VLTAIIHDILIILSAGLAAGLICRRLGISVLVGYLVIGAIIGKSTLNLTNDENHEIEYIATLRY
jgi:CPA2 family monovalent cation:H+ antiporter-2